MAFTDAEEKRIQAIEVAINQIQTAILNLVSKKEYRQTVLIRQEEIESLQKRVAALETQLRTLQGQIG